MAREEQQGASLPLMTVGYFMFGCVRKFKFRVACAEFVPSLTMPSEGRGWISEAMIFLFNLVF